MNTTLGTTSFFLLLGAFAFILFIILFLAKTSEYMTRARFKKYLFGTIALFVLLAGFVYLRQRPEPKRIRIAVLPVQETLYSEANVWQSWFIADQAGRCLQKSLPEPYLVYPLAWLRQAMDMDSLSDIDYLQSYAERIGLDYAVLAGPNAAPDAVALDYLFVRVQSPSIIKKSRIVVAPEHVIDLGRLLAAEAMPCLGKSWIADSTTQATITVEQARLISEAENDLAAADYVRAVQTAEAGYRLDSTLVTARNLLAACLLQASRDREQKGEKEIANRMRALHLCESTILRGAATDGGAYRLLGLYYLLEQIWNKSAQHLQKAIEMNRDDAEAYSLFAYLNDFRFKQIGFKDDEKLLLHVLRLNPCDESARLRLAELYFSRNYLKLAEKQIRALLTIHPRSIDGLMFLGKLASVKRDFIELTRIYDTIFRIAPHNADAYYNLGIYYFQNEDMDNAERLFSRAVRLDNHADSHLYLGQIYESRGRIDKAIEEYRLRIRGKKGVNDRFADVARLRLFELMKPDSAVLKPYVR